MYVMRGRSMQVLWWTLAVARMVAAGISCLGNPCLHGICIDDINSTYACYCVDGYTGVQCQTNWDECWSSPCQNGGTCVDGIATYNCSCPDGFIGENCETNFNECESNPCQNNGTCIDLTNGYVCSCVPGFSGEHCEVDVAVCNSSEEVRCYNGGQCIEGPGFKFYCKCMPGWAGPKCDNQIDECESNPCQNGGVCIDVHADYMCACGFGYTGKSCEVQIEFCDENSCSNNALCVVEDGIRVCYCVPDFHGERCELQYDECLLGPRCLNGGTCIDGVDNFTCSCPQRLTGPLCECLILDDGTHDCEYVSPTPFPETTTNTTIYEEVTTIATELITTASSTEYNDTIPRTATTESGELTAMTTETYTTSISTTNIVYSTEITTQKRCEITETTTNVEEQVTDKLEITEVPDKQTRQTIESDNSKVETTTESQEPETTTTKPTIFTITDGRDPTVTTSTSESTTVEVVTKEMTAEITSTPKMDMTTDKMFTDTPTEHPLTDLPTPPPHATTEAMDVTTTDTSSHTTEQAECTDSACNNHGTCVNTPHGIRCHCIFNYAGRFCDEKILVTSAAFGGNSYISHKIRNSTTIVIEFNAKSLITDGQIMHVVIAKGVYMELFMNSGLLKFKFSCGYQTMLLSELKTFVNKGFPMQIETRLDLYLKEQHCNATLRLNDTVAMSGGQVANITILDGNSTLHLGNAPEIRDAETKPFIGCIKDLVVSNTSPDLYILTPPDPIFFGDNCVPKEQNCESAVSQVNGEKREIFGDALEAGYIRECVSLSCLSSPCVNGGTCSDHNGGYTCACANGWVGAHCNHSVCENNPCHSGGSCVKHPGSGFLCLCPYGRHGIFCEYNVEITRPSLAPISTGISSYLMYPLSPSALNSDRFDLRLRFQTPDMDQIALLAFVGQNGRHDSRSQHLALTFVKGYIMLTWNLGSGPRRIFTARALGSRRGGHSVRVWRRARSAGISVDGRHNVSGNAPAHDTKMTVLPYIYIGGHPSANFVELPHDLPLHSGWRGCVWEVGGQVVGGVALGGRGAGQCGVAQCTARSCNAPRGVCIHSPATYGCICNEGWFGATCASEHNPCDVATSPCRGRCVLTASGAACDCPYGKTGQNCDQDLVPTDVLFSGTRSFLELHPRAIASVSLSIEADIKPAKERGLLVFADTPHFYTALSLQGALLEYRWTDRVSGVTSLVRSGVVLSMSQWHSVKAGRYGSRLYVWVDGALSTEAMGAHAYPHTASNATILLGGAKDLSTLPFDSASGAPESFSGCIRNLHVNNIILPLEPQNIVGGQNVLDCDGTACGVEACGGGACVVEGGRARCACGGGRCRRGAACLAALCAPPRGHCRAALCVCAAGYAGEHCQTKINITIPQFEGESLMSLGRRASALNKGEQRAPLGSPRYVALNFTTAHTAGLLLWATMDADYIGIGLDGGYLKLAWALHPSTKDIETNTRLEIEGSRIEPSRMNSKVIPNAGFLADGEWHTLVLRVVDANITLTVDAQLAYVEEPGFTNFEYNDVDLYIGGITSEESAIAKKIFPDNFKGCIDRISTKEGTFVANYTEMYSENVRSCQLFPPT